MTRRIAAAIVAFVLVGVAVPIVFPPEYMYAEDEGYAYCTPAKLGELEFPTSELTGRLRIAFGADPAADPNTWQWTDVSAYVRHADRVKVTYGRSGESSTAEPGRMTLSLNSDEGRFVPGFATGAYYPNITIGTPIEWHVNPGNGLYERFQGFVSEWRPRWDETGTQTIVDIRADGVSRRLGRGEAERTPIERAIHATDPEAYWTLGDGSDATVAGSAVGGPAMTVFTGTVAFGADSDLHPDLPTPDLSLGGLTGAISGVDASAWHIEFLLRVDAYDGAAGLRLYTGLSPTHAVFRFFPQASAGDEMTVFIGGPSDENLSALTGQLVSDFLGVWHHYVITAEQISSNVRVTLYVDGVAHAQQTSSGTLQAPSSVLVGQNIGAIDSAAHVAIGSGTAFSAAFDAINEYDGETARERFARTCTEESIIFTVDTGSTSTMGPQGVGTTLGLLRESETADHGLMSDYQFGTRLIPRSTRYNRAPDIELDSGLLAMPPQPSLDDFSALNDVRVSRPDGVRVGAQDSEDIARRGRYDSDATVNAAQDELVNHAEWLVHLGTVEGMRYPRLSLNLRRQPELIQAWCNAGLGARIRVTGLPASHPVDGIDLFIEGYTETFDSFRWSVEINASPARPYEVFQVESTDLGRLDSGDSTLASAIDADDTSLSVATPSDPLWTTAAGDLPLDVEIGGEQITVSAISGASSPQTFTVTRSVNGVVKSHAAGASVSLWRPGQIAL